MKMHGKVGKVTPGNCFTGKKGGKKLRRKGQRGKTTRKMRRARMRTHRNRYNQ
jgi:hypothetical protein